MRTELKHAYCIIAHSEPRLLEVLIGLIDDGRNDIFLLIDKEADLPTVNIRTEKAGLYLVPRMSIHWGDISQVKAELSVFSSALEHGPYAIYHLISGVDLPIKSQDYIHDFIREHPHTEFIEFAQDNHNNKDLVHKTRYYHSFIPYRFSHKKNGMARILGSLCGLLLLRLQQALRTRRNFDVPIRKGSNWCSITHELCSWLVQRRGYILKTFQWVLCPDEVFMQSLVMDSPFKDRLYHPHRGDSCNLRAIDWSRGIPYTWGRQPVGKDGKTDLRLLKESNALFARKFSSQYMEIVKDVENLVLGDLSKNASGHKQ